MTQLAFTLVNPQNGNLAFKIFTFEDNSNFDHVQRHNYYSVILISKGSGRLKADFSEYDLSQNTVMSFAPYQPFMINAKQELSGTMLCFHSDFFCIHKHQKEVACNGVLFNNIYESPLFSLTPPEIDKLLELIEQMKAEMQNTEIGQYELLISLLKVFLITASRLKVMHKPGTDQILSKGKEPFILQDLKDAIESNFKTKHKVSDYSDLLNTSSKTLAKITKNHFNKTLTDLIVERIIIEAKRDLYLTSKAVKEIAYDLGFNDEYYFSRFFKKNADVSPQLYRDTVDFAKAES